jgi:hypothetical protein
VCFQCRYNWLAHQASAAAGPARAAVIEDKQAYRFTPEELARLRIYRRAVQARFFSDDLTR